MAYQSLYRTYRPQRFGDLVGQEHVVGALRSAIVDGRVGHAYLLSGPRGTGKTTTARLLAKALNCLARGDDGEPCGTCGNCVAVAAGTFSDLIELDAASNTGVDAMRDLIERVHLGLGATSRRKVYLIDEVHMLSTAAGNALLKTLEEPPDHVVFVLATTNPERVLPTIRSRTQHFELTLLPTDVLAAHLASVVTAEGVAAEPGALDAVARAAGGSVRDALSILEQVLSQRDGPVTEARVRETLGHVPFTLRMDVAHAVAAEDPAGALAGVARLLTAGHDPRRVAEDLLRSLRDAFLLVAGRGEVPVDVSPDERASLIELGTALGDATLVRAMETLGDAIVDMRGTDAVDPALALEVAVVRLARRDVGPPLQALAERVARLERAVGGGSAPVAAPAAGAPAPTTAPTARRDVPPPAPAAAGRAPHPTAATAGAEAGPATPADRAGGVERSARAERTADVAFDLGDVIVAWDRVLNGLPKGLRVAVAEAQPVAVEGNVIVFGVSPRQIDLVKPRFQKEAHVIREQFIAALGAPPRFKFTTHEFTVPVPEREPTAAGGVPVTGPAERHDRVDRQGAAATQVNAIGPEPVSVGPGPEPAGGTAPGECVDLTEFTETVPAGPTGTVGRLQAAFRATIVEERPTT